MQGEIERVAKLGTLSARKPFYSVVGGTLSSKCALMFIHQYVIAYFSFSHCALNTREEMYAVWIQILKHRTFLISTLFNVLYFLAKLGGYAPQLVHMQ